MKKDYYYTILILGTKYFTELKNDLALFLGTSSDLRKYFIPENIHNINIDMFQMYKKYIWMGFQFKINYLIDL